MTTPISPDGKPVTLDTASIDGFAAALRGPLLRPRDPGYDDARSIWNGMIDRRPAMIVRCLGVADVIECVNFARENNVLLSIKSGGHNISGLSIADGALTIDTSLMRGVWVNAEERIAIAQSGCVLGDVDRETQVHGLAAVLGFVSNTGIAGLTLGGGFGYLSRQYGWTTDNTRSFEIVTADGQVRRASADENPDLFWGLCGGGGNFGVVTKIEYDLYPVGPEVMAGALVWHGDDATDVLAMYREHIADTPREHACVAVLRIAPPAPWLPAEVHGQPIIALFVNDTGPMAEAERRAAKLRSFGSPVGDILQPRPYIQQQSILDPTQPNGRRYYWKSEYLPAVEEAFTDTLVDHFKTITSPYSAILIFPLDGRIGELPDDVSAVGNRDTRFVTNFAASWENPAEDNRHVGWARSAWESVRPFSTGGTYLNFLTEEEGDERVRDALRSSYDRLIDIKTKYDPGNLFRTNKNIVPR